MYKLSRYILIIFVYIFSADSSESYSHHGYMNVNGLFSSEQIDPFDTSVFDVANSPIHNLPSYSDVPNTINNYSVPENNMKLDMNFITELEKSLMSNKEAEANTHNTNNQVVLAPPNVMPKKLNTEHLNSAIPRPSSSISAHTSASSSYYSTTELDLSSFVSKYDSDPMYAANLNLTENKVKSMSISNIPSSKNVDCTSDNYCRNDLHSNVKPNNLTVASNYSSPYYSPPVEPARYYSHTPNMYQIVPEPNMVV